MAKLIFRNDQMRKVIAFNKLGTKYRRSYDSAVAAYEHETKKEFRFTGTDEEALAPYFTTDIPRLIFVKDQGIYLMAAVKGQDSQMFNNQREDLCYADGCNPDTDEDYYDRSRDAVGGDDFAMDIDDMAFIEKWVELGYDIFFDVTQDQFKIGATKSKNPA
jgi:hypothetical protein